MDRADLHRQRARPARRATLRQIVDRSCARPIAADRRRVHAHPGSRPEGAGSRSASRAPATSTEFTADGKRAILERLTAAEGFEQFLDKQVHRHQALRPRRRRDARSRRSSRSSSAAASSASKEIVIGMPHRGRLNVLTNVMGKPFAAIFSEFQGNPPNPEDVQGSGDVKYHLGTSADREFDGNVVHLSLTANPVASRGGQPGGPRQGARQAGAARRHRAQPGHGPADARRRGLRRPGPGGRDARSLASSTATAPAARSISSSTTRSASPPSGDVALRPLLHGRRQDASRRRSSTSTATTPRRWSMSAASPPSSASSSRRTW